MSELVSVIMPCFNDGAYIEESIACVWKQTYPSIELIVIDDGSDEKQTIDILERIKDDERCTVVQTAHEGPSGARNAGIRQAKGKYILPLDSDDLIDKTYIEKAFRAIEEKPERGVVYCFADLFGEDSGPWNLPPYSFKQMLRDNIVFITALFYREDWAKVGGFNTNMKQGMEDYDFFIGLLEIGREIYQIPEVLFHYRIKKKSRTTALMDDIDCVKDMYRRIYENHPAFYEKYKNEYALELREVLIEQIFIRRRMSESVEMYQKIKEIPLVHWIIRRIMRRGIKS